MDLPALTLARRAQERAEREGLLSSGMESLLAEAQSKLHALRETAGEDESARTLGDLLFALADLARQLGVDAESALRTATMRFGEGIAVGRSKRGAS
jgi:ATP diphosphatase